jgi:hypothetical protein
MISARTTFALAGHTTTPNDLKREGGGQKLRGVYLPFWTFDAHAESDWRAESGDYYYETEWVTVVRDGKTVREQQQVQKIRWYWTHGHHSGDYDDVLVLAPRAASPPLFYRKSIPTIPNN